jgi:hypothetical protein
MTDLENEHHAEDASPTHPDDDSSSNEVIPDPLATPSLVIPHEGIVAEKSSAEDPPPDGGLQAWLQVLGSFFLFFNSW